MTYSLKELCIKTYNLINKINMHLTPGITRGKKTTIMKPCLQFLKRAKLKVQSVMCDESYSKLIKSTFVEICCYLKVWDYLLEILAF